MKGVVMLSFLFLLFVVVSPHSSMAVDCTQAPNIAYSGSGASAYASWCRACGGTYTMSSGNPSCSRGPNWGGGGGGGAMPAGGEPVMNFMKGMMGAMEQLQADQEKAKQETVVAPQQQNPAANQALQAQQQAANAAAHAAAREKKEKLHLEIDALLMDRGPKSAVPFFRNEDASKPIVDCPKLKKDVSQLKTGLEVQREAIRRTEEQLISAEEQNKKDLDEVDTTLAWVAYDQLRPLLLSGSSLEKVFTKKISDPLWGSWVREWGFNKWEALRMAYDDSLSAYRKFPKVYKATKKYASEMLQTTDNAVTAYRNMYEFLRDSGGIDAMGKIGIKVLDYQADKKLAKSAVWRYIGGPWGASVYRVTKAGLDVAIALKKEDVSFIDRTSAARNLSNLQAELNKVDGRILDMETQLMEQCSGAKQKN